MMTLGVNIDHVATLREARYRGRRIGEPDPVAAALTCEEAGAHGITAHLREDRRHIQDADILELRRRLRTRLNFEIANTDEIRALALRIVPAAVCLVPERREEVTTEGGLDVAAGISPLSDACGQFRSAGISVSLFIAPDADQIDAAARTGADAVELHTGAFAEGFADPDERERQLARLREGAERAHGLGLTVNAGHGLNYENVEWMHRVPHLAELNIGHSIVSRAVMIGLAAAVREMLDLLKSG